MQELKIAIEELTSIYRARDERALSAHLRRLTESASPVWRDYWAGLHEALSPDSELLCWCKSAPGANYQVAQLLSTRLSGRYGQPLAKAIVRRLAPDYRRAPLWKKRIVRVLGRGLDPSTDTDAADLLLRLHDKYDVDGKSRVQFLHALAPAGLSIARPAIEHHLFVRGAIAGVHAALALLSHYPGEEAAEMVRRAILETTSPGRSALYSARRGDTLALGPIERRIAENGSLEAEQRVHLAIAKHAIQGDELALERTLRSRPKKLDLWRVVPLVERLEPPTATRLLTLLLRDTPNFLAIEALGRLGPEGRQAVRRARKALPRSLDSTVAQALGEQRSPDEFLDEAKRIGTRDEDRRQAYDLKFSPPPRGDFGSAHIPRLAGLLAHRHFAAFAAAQLDRLGTDEALEHLMACALDSSSPGCKNARHLIWKRGISGERRPRIPAGDS